MATSPIQSEKEMQAAIYAQAQDDVATARASGASDLYLSTDLAPDLAVLPPDIGSLTALNRLDLWGTRVSDISALSGLTALEYLDLRGTQVSDISALSGLTGLATLYLTGTPVSDISALSGLTALTELSLTGAQVSDISALSGLTALSSLDLSGTQVSDISALSGLTALSSFNLSGTPVSDISVLSGLEDLKHLDLSGTQVSDLSPVLSLTQLADAPRSAGLVFKNTVAALADPRIAEIAEIEDNAKRATDLFSYLSETPKGVARSIDKLDTRVDTTQQDVTKLETRVSKAIERLDGFDADYESRLDAAATAFREANALKAPVVLWQEKETKHQAESATARNFFIGSLFATGLLVIVLAYLLIFCKDVAYALVAPIGCDPAKPETCSGFSARGLSILTLLAAFFTCLLWYVRMQMKLFLSERHLALDARERTAFAQTYIGFLAEKDSSDEAAGQRAAVYAALFRPSTDGIVKDEGGLDPSIAAALSKFLTKSS